MGDQPSPELVQAYSWASATQMLSGRYREGRALSERGLALATELGLAALRSHLLNTLGVCQLFVGEIDGIGRIEEALRIALEVGEPDAIGRAYINLCDQFVRTGRFREAVEVAEEGREATRRLGAPAIEWFIAGNEALALARLGRYEEADDLTRVMLDEQRSVLGVVGVVNAGMTRIELLIRRGLHSEARALADEILGLARGLGGTEFLGQSLVTEAELELARGNEAAARQALREAVEIAAEEDIGHLVQMLPASARLFPGDEVRQLLKRARDFPSMPLTDACRVEADAVLTNDPGRFLEAAQFYRKVEMPWEEARCLAGGGDESAAAALYDRLGVPPPRHV